MHVFRKPRPLRMAKVSLEGGPASLPGAHVQQEDHADDEGDGDAGEGAQRPRGVAPVRGGAEPASVAAEQRLGDHQMASPKQGGMEDEFLSCPICFDILKEPKTLSCLHRFCQECLHGFLQRHKTSAIARHRGFQCPVCREFIKAPDLNSTPAEWAALFRTDFHLKNLIKFVESRPGRRLDRPANPCSLHGHAECDLYCADCQATICHLCAGISHRGCSRVITVAEAARDKRQAAVACIKEISLKIKEACDLEKSREKCLDQLDNQRAAAEKAIANVVKDLHSRIKVAEDKLMNRLAEDFESLHGKITVKVLQFENHLSKLRENVDMFSSNLESIPDNDVLKATSLLEAGTFGNGLDIRSYRSFLANVASIKIVLDKQTIPSIHLGKITIKGAEDELSTSNLSLSSSEASVLESKSFLDRIRNLGKKNENDCSAPPYHYGREEDRPSVPRMQTSLRPRPSRASTVKRHAVSASSQSASADDSSVSDRSSGDSGAFLTFRGQNRSEERVSENPNVTHQHRRPSILDANHRPESQDEAPSSISRLRTINTRFREDQDTPKLRDLIVLGGSEAVLVTDWANQCVKALYGRRERDTRLVLGGKPWAITQISESLAAVSLPVSTQICIIKIGTNLSVQNSFV
ncbi:hypothetical protein EGW08_008952 [Elysia chlorotica]|uniref:RING-type domain-containing protein n=1 Tax=Elysia chlorotica TaxID=188477 RepID=A0A3S0ZNP1_ELYCH|nr:hypothetical protein EGW08_008952 [Elysia chlorotica]